MKKLFLYFTILVINLSLFADDTIISATNINELNHRIDIIQRDQTNYQIEKDLLKEAYSTNFQTVNIIITLVLGVFSVIGFFGLKNINKLADEYQNKLEKLKKIHSDFEEQIQKTSSMQKEIKVENKKIEEINTEQNMKITLLELENEINMLITKRNYSKAIDQIEVALKIDPNKCSLLDLYGFCLFKLQMFEKGIAIFEKSLAQDNSDTMAILNLLEAYLISGKLQKFSDLNMRSEELLESDIRFLPIYKYLQLLYKYVCGKPIVKDAITFKKELSNNLFECFEWDYADVKKYLLSKSTTLNKTALVDFINFLRNNNELTSSAKKNMS